MKDEKMHKINIKNILKITKKHVILSEARSAINSKIYITTFSLVYKGCHQKRKKRYIYSYIPKRWLQWLHRSLAGARGGYTGGYKIATHPKA
jgi:hypothetical protein